MPAKAEPYIIVRSMVAINKSQNHCLKKKKQEVS
jgi:hypothetical protein